jgi:hypothetical protein
MTPDVLGARDSTVFQLPECNTVATLQRPRIGSHRGQHIPGAQPLLSMFLIVYGDVQQRPISTQERSHRPDKPCPQAIGIDRNTDRHPFVSGSGSQQPGQRAMELMLEHPNLLDVPAYQPAHFGSRAGLPAD